MEKVVRLMPQLLWLWEKGSQYPQKNRVEGFQSWSGHFKEETNLLHLVGSEPWTVQPMAKSLCWLHFSSSLCETRTPSKNSLLVTQFSSLHVTNILIHEWLNDTKYTNNVSLNLKMTVNDEMKQMWMWTTVFCMQSGRSSNITSKKAATIICYFDVDITVTCFSL